MSSYYNQYAYYPVELKEAIAITGDINLFSELNIPKSTTRDWAKKDPPDIVSPKTLNIIQTANLENKIKKKDEEIARLQEKIALISKVYADMGLIPKNTKIQDIEIKKRVLNSINDLQKILTTEQVLKTIAFSKSKLTRWKKEIKIDRDVPIKEYEQNHPQALSEKEFMVMKSLYTNPDYAHYPVCALHFLAKREDILHCSINTWYKYSKIYNLARPFLRYNLKEYKEGFFVKNVQDIKRMINTYKEEKLKGDSEYNEYSLGYKVIEVNNLEAIKQTYIATDGKTKSIFVEIPGESNVYSFTFAVFSSECEKDIDEILKTISIR